MRTAALCLAALVSPLAAADYYVSAIRGQDTNPGTFAAPFRTISKATQVVTSGDRIYVLQGRYTPTLGESFPLTVPAGVDMLGVDARTCVIDAEFDPKSATNPHAGNLVNILERTRFAHLSVINGARDPANPGAHWWKIAILVQGQGGNSSAVEIDHVILDEVSRGIVVGYAVGDHNLSGIDIHDCILQRFYVEALNSWANNGTASGNRIYNCTVVGHVNPATNKPFNRACSSFGPGAQFDVRNTILVRGDWAGIEASAQATITSDYNCLFQAGYQGLTGGARDVVADPLLAQLPTVALGVDAHLLGTRSPCWNKGLTLTGQLQHTDMDLRSARVQAAVVDIGADEFGGHDAYFLGVPRTGATVRMAAVGNPSTPVVFALGFKSLQQGVPIPGFGGLLWLDPALPILVTVATKDASGWAVVPLPLPADTSLQMLELDLQGIDTPSPQFSDLDQVRIV